MNQNALVPAAPPSSGGSAEGLYVVFKVDGVDYALAATEVLQMESYTGATPVPGAPSFVPGIIQLRGRVVPVIDLRLRFQLAATPVTLESRVIVVEKEGRAVALLAETAREVVRIAKGEHRLPPRLVEDGGFIRSVVQAGNRTILVLDFENVIGAGLDAPRTEEKPGFAPKEPIDV